ncbi:MAG TPA: hypothetical protein VJ790_03100 [Dongiaceae bacterium]|nr:hypothetical protein [Dongiaceae bacterium]
MIIDVQPSFAPPAWLVAGISALIGTMPSVATIERHDENGRRSNASWAGLPAHPTTVSSPPTGFL